MIENLRRTSTASCHSDAAGPTGPVTATGAPVVALVGAPNVGKTTLFNTLTGARRETGNWPGTSVAVGHGSWQLPRRPAAEVAVVDLPGTYSLDPLSPDEALTRALLVEVAAAERPEVTVVVLDASALARSLYLLAQVRELPGRVIGVLTMNDVAAGLSAYPRLAARRRPDGRLACAADAVPPWAGSRERLAAPIPPGRLDAPAEPRRPRRPGRPRRPR